MPLSNLPGPWRWEKRGDRWWRIHDRLNIEDGPHTWNELSGGLDDFGEHVRWYDRQGEPIPLLVWSDLLSDEDYKIVAQDVFVMGDGPVEVSTVWLGLNHNWWPNGPPLIFETMIFGGDLDLECQRYATEEQARQGHVETCRMVQVLCAAQNKDGEQS